VIIRGLTFLENCCNYDPPGKLLEYSWNLDPAGYIPGIL